jgi:hypothetical protein
MKNGSMFTALFVALGLTLAGWFVGHGFLGARTVDRFVTVKGVSQREVQADVVGRFCEGERRTRS